MSSIRPADADVCSFPDASAIDTCAIWNVLSSGKLSRASYRQRRHYLVAEFVRYECLAKPRRTPTTIQQRMLVELRELIAESRHFEVMSLEVDDLREIARLHAVRRLGRGELAAMVLARKIRQGFMTDDRGARALAASELPEVRVRTTPHLLGWLVYVGEVSDGEARDIIAEHSAVAGPSNLAKYMEACYLAGLQHRLAAKGQAQKT